MNEEMMTTGFTGGDTATGPTAGFDPVMKMRAKIKDLKGLVAPGNKLSTSNKKKVKKEDYQYEAKVDKKLPEYKRATARDKRYGNPHGSHELGGGIRKDRRADHEAKRGVKKEDWKPEIEHSKLGDAVKKKREKKRKEAESSLPPHLRLDVMKKAFAHTNEEEVKEAIAPSPQEIQVHKKISMLQQKLAQLRKKTVNQAGKGAAAATSQEAPQESTAYKYVSSINEKRKTKVNLNPTTKDTKGEGKFINKYNPRYLSYTESVVDRCPPNKLFQYKVKLPEVGETVVYANSPAELMQKLRLLINPRFRGGIEIDRIFPHDAYKFFTDKRTKALRRK